MPTSKPVALQQAFRKKQAQQQGSPEQAQAALNAMLRKPNIRAMLIRLRDK